jgi:NAD-dependent deacetylase
VVWFGEALPPEALAAAEEAVRSCDGMIVVGTSGLVFPAARLPMLALQLHKPLIVVDPHPLSEALAGALWLPGRASELLPAVVDGLKRTS